MSMKQVTDLTERATKLVERSNGEEAPYAALSVAQAQVYATLAGAVATTGLMERLCAPPLVMHRGDRRYSGEDLSRMQDAEPYQDPWSDSFAPTDQQVYDLLMMAESSTTQSTIQGWSSLQRVEAANWATREYLYASDNIDVTRTEKPGFIL